jgi:hypothetical protein
MQVVFLTMVDVGNLDTKLVYYFKLSFIMTKLGNLDVIFGVILNCFVMTMMGNLDVNIGFIWNYFS